MPAEPSTSEPVTPSRAVTVVLPESEWRAFSRLEMDPAGWLRALIRQRLQNAPDPAEVNPAPPGAPR